MNAVTDPRTPVIVAARRTPFGTADRALRALSVDQLAATVIRALTEGAMPEAVDEVILGVARGPGGNPARVAALAAGLSVDQSALTVDRQCASGLEAVSLAALKIQAADADVVVAGGAESASQANPGRARMAPEAEMDPDMGAAADAVAAARKINRARQDEYAARSHERAVQARDAGVFDAELVPLPELARDERPRFGMTQQRLSRFPPAFSPDGTSTAGNSCGVSDGAAGVLMVPEHLRAGRFGLRVLASAHGGVDPRLCGLGLVPAVQLCLKRAGLSLSDVAVIEFNEAFAGQVLACADDLHLNDARICPDGGAIALGHPWGASGAALVVRLFAQLRLAPSGSYGLAALSAGGGQGVAVLVQSVHAEVNRDSPGRPA